MTVSSTSEFQSVMFEGSIWIFRGVDPVVLFTIFAKFKLAMSYRTP